MNKITFPLKLHMQGPAVADLQDTLQLCMDRGVILVNDEGARKELLAALKHKRVEGSISNFKAGVTETRFKAPSNKPQDIRQIIDSLDVVNNRLTDTADRHDPTQGATNWSSPGAPGQKKMYPPDGIPPWAQTMQHIIVPGVPGDVFTFYK